MAINRRKFIKLAGAAAIGLTSTPFLPLAYGGTRPEASGFTNPLPVPGPKGLFGILTPNGPLELKVKAMQGLLPANLKSPMWVYECRHNDNIYYNPIIKMSQGESFEAVLMNELPDPTIVHWHGLDAHWKQVGHPSYAIGSGESYSYAFPLTNRAGTYWYHPHPEGQTGKQTFMGLASFFLVEDDEERALARELDLQLGETDLPLLIQDKRFDHHGHLSYQPGRNDYMMGYLGDKILVNGAIDPYLDVSQRVYRFRLLNGSTARLFKLGFASEGRLQTFSLIGNDGGMIPTCQTIDQLFLAPGERADVLVDFSGTKLGQEVFLYNLPFDPMHNEGGHENRAGHEHGTAVLEEGVKFPILRFRVTQKSKYDRSIPQRLCGSPDDLKNTARIQSFTFAMRHRPTGWMINNLAYAENEVPVRVEARHVEIWQFKNTSKSMPHPQHVHGYLFRVLNRKRSPQQVKQLALDESGILPAELGWKDTVLTWPGEEVTVGIDFSKPDYPGEQMFLMHCHNLEHEDMGMMLNFSVI